MINEWVFSLLLPKLNATRNRHHRLNVGSELDSRPAAPQQQASEKLDRSSVHLELVVLQTELHTRRRVEGLEAEAGPRWSARRGGSTHVQP
jgi:hypothetical protein